MLRKNFKIQKKLARNCNKFKSRSVSGKKKESERKKFQRIKHVELTIKSHKAEQFFFLYILIIFSTTSFCHCHKKILKVFQTFNLK